MLRQKPTYFAFWEPLNLYLLHNNIKAKILNLFRPARKTCLEVLINFVWSCLKTIDLRYGSEDQWQFHIHVYV